MPDIGATKSSAALSAALRLLAGKRLSRLQLSQKLRDRGYPPGDVDDAVSECERLRYIDDRSYAELYVKSVLERKPLGRMRLLNELRKHGIDADLAREVLDQHTVEDESERIDRALTKLEALRPQDSFGQLGRRLERLGFTAPQIFAAMRRRAETRGFKADDLAEQE